MIARTSILQNLKRLDSLYNKSKSTKQSLFLSKLAVLELCGWIEESMDDIVHRFSMRGLRDSSNRNYVEEFIIKRTYGFEYDRHFRAMLISVIGLIYVEKLERKVNKTKFQNLKGTLESLKTYRDVEAHTHIKGVTKRFDAPSAIISKFFVVYDGLKDFEENLKKLSS
jgi:hypothetical protein